MEYVEPICLLVVIVASVIGYEAGRRVARNLDADSRPYKWTCMEPGCTFKIESNQLDWVMNIAKTHEELTHHVH